MNPLLLLGIAVAFLALTGKSGASTPNGQATQPGTPSEPEPLAPTFNNVPFTTKTKTPTTLQETTTAPVVGISPPAPDSSPPYIYDLAAGPAQTGWLGANDSPSESFAAVPPME